MELFFFSGWVLLVLLYSFLVGYARLGPMSLQDSELSGELGRTAFAGSIRWKQIYSATSKTVQRRVFDVC